MAHTKSSKKRIEIGERNRLRNQSIKSKVKTFAKKVILAVEQNDVENAKLALSNAFSQLDKAVAKGVYKKNTASRTKSRLSVKVQNIVK